VDRRFIAVACAASGRDGTTVLLIDQHAAHERIRVEQLEGAMFGTSRGGVLGGRRHDCPRTSHLAAGQRRCPRGGAGCVS
jgi:hypothetical protein